MLEDTLNIFFSRNLCFLLKHLQDEKYEHIEADEMKKVQQKIDDRFNWFNQISNELGKCPPTNNPPVYPSQVETEKKVSISLFYETNNN